MCCNDGGTSLVVTVRIQTVLQRTVKTLRLNRSLICVVVHDYRV